MPTISVSSEFKAAADKKHESIHAAVSPMHILFVADFAATQNINAVIEVDRDNFEEVFSQLQVKIEININNNSNSVEMPIIELDNFTPDEIFENTDVFKKLRQLRCQLNNTKTFQVAASEIRQWSSEGFSNDANEPVQENTHLKNDGGLLDSIIGGTSRTGKPSSEPLVSQLIKELVKPYIVEADDPSKEVYVRAVDEAIAAQMRNILHHKYFQQVESAWRDLFMLVKRLETGRSLKLFMLNSAKHVADENLQKINSENSWSFILNHFTYEANLPDINLIKKMAVYAQQKNTLVLSAAGASFMGLQQFDQRLPHDEWPIQLDENIEREWNQLRSSDSASFISLSSPGFLARYVYGKKHKPVSHFSFEEVLNPAAQDEYLWGNSATLFALLIAQAFIKNGWSLNPYQQNRIADLATYYFDDEGEMVMLPCAEINLSTQAAELLRQKGLVPVYSVQNEASVQLGKLSSLANNRLFNIPWLSANSMTRI